MMSCREPAPMESPMVLRASNLRERNLASEVAADCCSSRKLRWTVSRSS